VGYISSSPRFPSFLLPPVLLLLLLLLPTD
jgi:hypothetical protein